MRGRWQARTVAESCGSLCPAGSFTSWLYWGSYPAFPLSLPWTPSREVPRDLCKAHPLPGEETEDLKESG